MELEQVIVRTELKEIKISDVIKRAVNIIVVPGEEIRYTPQTENYFVVVPQKGSCLFKTENNPNGGFIVHNSNTLKFPQNKGETYIVQLSALAKRPVFLIILEF